MFPLAIIYGVIVWLRNRLYDAGFFSSVQFDLPVIIVGNLSTGGTGKTPHVEYLVRLLQYRFRVATLSRGYKRHTQGFLLADETASALRLGDEPMQYYFKFPDLVVSVAEDRVTGIPAILQRRPDVDVVLLDDAYQHRSVRPGLSILITDYAQPYYNDHILPFGNLREGRAASNRADIIIVSKCPQSLTAAQSVEIIQKVKPSEQQKVFFTGIRYQAPVSFFDNTELSFSQKNVVLVCGIARPDSLVRYLESQALSVHTLSYPDHHYFVTSDLEEIRDAFQNWNAPDKIIVTTEKDAARLRLHFSRLTEWQLPIAVLPIEVQFLLDGQPQFDRIVDTYVESASAERMA